MATGVKVEQAPSRPSRAKGASPSVAGEETVGQITCLECGRSDIKNKTGMAQHVMRSHDFPSLAAYETAHGVTIT
jgi:hypothetical protein